MEIITQVLDVEVGQRKYSSIQDHRSCCSATNKGVLLHPSASQEDIKLVEKILKVPADIGTVNNGTSLVGACAVATTKGVIVSLNTTGPELARIEETFGFLEGYL